MSRTYRKSSITEKETIVHYVNNHIDYLNRRSFYYEYYLTERDQKAYDKAMEEWVTEYHRAITRPYIGIFNLYPAQPNIWDFKSARVVFKKIDYDEEIKEVTEEYKKYKRDGRFYNGNLDHSFRKNCAKELRVHNRRLVRQIIKGDDHWEDKPYPDTYLGKTHIWDYY